MFDSLRMWQTNIAHKRKQVLCHTSRNYVPTDEIARSHANSHGAHDPRNWNEFNPLPMRNPDKIGQVACQILRRYPAIFPPSLASKMLHETHNMFYTVSFMFQMKHSLAP
ncbi:MAG: hypothetical protein Kow0099_39360 [Candidatus Abyssubacteria bacterium]